MKRLVVIALLGSATAVAGFAQMRGMRMSAPPRGIARPMARAPMGFAHPRFGGMRPGFVSPRFGGMRPGFAPRRPMTFAPRPASTRGIITFGHINGGPFFFTQDRFRRHHRPHFHPFLFNSPFLFSGFYSPFYSPFYDPFFGDAFFADYGNANTNPPPSSYDSEVANSNINQLSSELQDLSSQVDLLREQDDMLRAELERRAAPQPQPSSGNVSPNPTEPPVVLVFRDGHRTEIQNYAIVGQTLWILSDKRSTKVPLSELNLDETTKVNRDRGLTFSVGPSTR
jgi:hypothetical protein